MKATIVGGMATTEDVAKRWEEVTKKPLTEGYGLTETSPVVTINSFTEFSGGIGYPIPSTNVAIMDDNENILALNEIGELVVKGPQVMQEYWRRPLETIQAFTADGWFKTADMAKMDEKGLLRIVDRKKDMIIVSGFNVFPNEVENILMSHPKILEAAVVGVPNLEKGGESVKAFIVKRDNDLTEEEILLYCRSVLTPYKIPHMIVFEKELPKTFVGKILRRKLREEEEELKEAA